MGAGVETTRELDAEVHEAAPRRGRLRRVGRRMGRGLLLLLALALIGTAIQEVLQRREAAAHPPPGELVELPDGRRIHLEVAGEQRGGTHGRVRARRGGIHSGLGMDGSGLRSPSTRRWSPTIVQGWAGAIRARTGQRWTG
jgi:hypothetical protein